MVTNATSFPCRCFGPGMPPAGRRVQAEAHADELVITVEGRLIRLPWKSCQVDGAGIENQQLVLTWHGDGGQWTVRPAEADTFATLIENAPPPLQQKLARWQQNVKGGRRGFRWLIVAAAVAALAALALALYLPKAGAAPF